MKACIGKYALSLKAKPTMLHVHTEALRLAVQYSEKLKAIDFLALGIQCC
jgi:hypothetical protein